MPYSRTTLFVLCTTLFGLCHLTRTDARTPKQWCQVKKYGSHGKYYDDEGWWHWHWVECKSVPSVVPTKVLSSAPSLSMSTSSISPSHGASSVTTIPTSRYTSRDTSYSSVPTSKSTIRNTSYSSAPTSKSTIQDTSYSSVTTTTSTSWKLSSSSAPTTTTLHQPTQSTPWCQIHSTEQDLETNMFVTVSFKYELSSILSMQLSTTVSNLESRLKDTLDATWMACKEDSRKRNLSPLLRLSSPYKDTPHSRTLRMSGLQLNPSDPIEHMSCSTLVSIDGEQCHVLNGSMTLYLQDESTESAMQLGQNVLRVIQSSMNGEDLLNATVGITGTYYLGGSVCHMSQDHVICEPDNSEPDNNSVVPSEVRSVNPSVAMSLGTVVPSVLSQETVNPSVAMSLGTVVPSVLSQETVSSSVPTSQPTQSTIVLDTIGGTTNDKESTNVSSANDVEEEENVSSTSNVISGLEIGLISGAVSLTLVVGAILRAKWHRVSKDSEDSYEGIWSVSSCGVST